MKYLVLAFAFGSAALPAFAGPGGCVHTKAEETAQISCADGQMWDEKSASCVTLES